MIHKTGYPTLILAAILCLILLTLTFFFAPNALIIVAILLAVFYLFLLSFFRNPTREIPQNHENKLYAPADGQVVVIEHINNADHYNDRRLQISIFMSPLNVHVNRSSIAGTIQLSDYRPGKYLPAWNPKSSSDNEQWLTVIENSNYSILLKQIAGALARRIVNNVKPGDIVMQGEEFGFIKFGSRVDILLPPNSKPLVGIGDKVKGNRDLIAELG